MLLVVKTVLGLKVLNPRGVNAISAKSVLIPSDFSGNRIGSRADSLGLQFGRGQRAQRRDADNHSPHHEPGGSTFVPH